MNDLMISKGRKYDYTFNFNRRLKYKEKQKLLHPSFHYFYKPKIKILFNFESKIILLTY